MANSWPTEPCPLPWHDGQNIDIVPDEKLVVVLTAEAFVASSLKVDTRGTYCDMIGESGVQVFRRVLVLGS